MALNGTFKSPPPPSSDRVSPLLAQAAPSSGPRDGDKDGAGRKPEGLYRRTAFKRSRTNRLASLCFAGAKPLRSVRGPYEIRPKSRPRNDVPVCCVEAPTPTRRSMTVGLVWIRAGLVRLCRSWRGALVVRMKAPKAAPAPMKKRNFLRSMPRPGESSLKERQSLVEDVWTTPISD